MRVLGDRLVVTATGELSDLNYKPKNWMGGVEVELVNTVALRVGGDTSVQTAEGLRLGLGIAARWGSFIGVGFDYSSTRRDFFGGVNRYRLGVQLLAATRGLDLSRL